MADTSINAGKKFKILTISGGGVKGIYSLYVLKQIEEKYCNLEKGETLSDYFDMICGTSTGGIIALGIASGLTVSKITELYEKNASIIFPNWQSSNWLSRWVMPCVNKLHQILGDKYTNDDLIKLLHEFFHDTTLGQSKNLVCIPTYELQTSTNVVFKFPHKEGGINRDKNIPMVTAAMATSAAPTYLPVYHYEGDTISGYFVDGGIYSNDVLMVGIIEAVEYFVGPGKQYDSMDILTVGNIKLSDGESPNNIDTYWNLLNINKLIDIIFRSNSNCTEHYADVLCRYMKSTNTRIECTDYPIEDAHDVALDNSNPKFIDSLKMFGNKDGIEYIDPTSERGSVANIKRFFSNKKTYNTSN